MSILDDDEERKKMHRYDTKQNFINTQIPLTWIITSFVAVIFFMIGLAVKINSQNQELTMKLDMVIGTMTEFKKQADNRDVSSVSMKEMLYANQRRLDIAEMRLKALEDRR